MQTHHSLKWLVAWSKPWLVLSAPWQLCFIPVKTASFCRWIHPGKCKWSPTFWSHCLLSLDFTFTYVHQILKFILLLNEDLRQSFDTTWQKPDKSDLNKFLGLVTLWWTNIAMENHHLSCIKNPVILSYVFGDPWSIIRRTAAPNSGFKLFWG